MSAVQHHWHALLDGVWHLRATRPGAATDSLAQNGDVFLCLECPGGFHLRYRWLALANPWPAGHPPPRADVRLWVSTALWWVDHTRPEIYGNPEVYPPQLEHSA